ncbi:MAG: hypothetical protein L0Y60_17850 [Beijerinckiaceae bacterium]|nr:hypothetical protein [Beijerinckiaceae bacterium]
MPADYTVFVTYLPTGAVLEMSLIDGNFAVSQFPEEYAYVGAAPGADNPLPPPITFPPSPADFPATIRDAVLSVDVKTYGIDAMFAVDHFSDRFSYVTTPGSTPLPPPAPAPPSVTLAILALSDWRFATDAVQGAFIGSILGATAGSTLSLADDAGGAVQLSGTALQVGPSAPIVPGQFAIQITETLASAQNSPNTTPFTIIETVAGGLPIWQLLLDKRAAFPHPLLA